MKQFYHRTKKTGDVKAGKCFFNQTQSESDQWVIVSNVSLRRLVETL